MGIMVVVEALPKPGRVEELQNALSLGLPASRAAEGCREIRAYLQDDGSTVIAVEHWDSKSDYEKYLAWRVESGAIKRLDTLLRAPMSIRFFEAMDV